MIELRNEYVKAGRDHKCSLCGETISKGTKHRIWTGKDGLEFITCRTHQECDRVTVIDDWDEIDWQTHGDDAELFRIRCDELREAGKL